MGPPNGPASARGPAWWIHWWSRVASAKASTRSWVIWNHSPTPISSPIRGGEGIDVDGAHRSS